MFFESWDLVLLFFITLVCGVSYMTINGSYIRRYPMQRSEHYLKSASYSIVCALTFLLLNSFSIKLSVYSLLLGILFGACTSLNQVSISLAIKTGPYGYSYVIMYFSTVITSLSGFIFWSEQISWLQMVGIVFMLSCFYFAVQNKSEDKKANLKWFILSLTSMCAVAAIGLLQKIHQLSEFKNELMGFMFIAFLSSAIISCLTFYLFRYKEKKVAVNCIKLFDSRRKVRAFLTTTVLGGVFYAFNNVLNMFLSGKVDAAVFFPIINGVPLMASLVVSLLLFKEKMTKRQWIGILLGVIGLSCLFIK